MFDRYLEHALKRFCFSDHKMAFVSGPRQCGKTTFAKMLLSRRKRGNYFNWDDIDFRRLWTKKPKLIIPENSPKTPLVVLDEIHKTKLWKRTLKGVYDTLEKPADILVTGSARLNVYKKGSDSLMGRYYHFRLHPFTLREMNDISELTPDVFINAIFNHSKTSRKKYKEDFQSLMKFGGFPEPLFMQNEKKTRLWRSSRIEKVVREDLRDISRIPELGRIEMLVSLLPERVGSLFSVASLREDLEVNFETVKRWLNYLKELYYLFEIKPYHKSISRALKKEGKIYLWDYSEIQNEAARFENLVACHLLKTCHYWSDTGEGKFELFYIRNKEKQEIDFLITKDKIPWLPVEAKLNECEPSPHWKKFLPYLACQNAVQIVASPTNYKLYSIDKKSVLVASAPDILPYFV